MLYCTGCEQICGIEDVLEGHLKSKHVVYACKDIAVECYTAVHYLHELSKLLNLENKMRQEDYLKVDSEAQDAAETNQIESDLGARNGGNKFLFKFRVAKEIEFINDRLKSIQKEMAAKFKQGNVGIALSDSMRMQVNSLMG